MIAGRGDDEPRSAYRLFLNSGLVLATLFILFGLLRSPPLQRLSSTTASLTAIVTEKILVGLGFPVIRSGAVLRDPVTSHALNVTAACDGYGLFAALLAVVVGCGIAQLSWSKILAGFLLGLAAIQVLNTIRVIILYITMPAGSSPFLIFHNLIFPVVSSDFVIILAAALSHSRAGTERGLQGWIPWILATLAATVVWYTSADAFTSWLLAGPLTVLFPWVSGGLVHGFGSAGDTSLATAILTSNSPVRALAIPYMPSVFLLGAPVLAASLIFSPRPLWQRGALVIAFYLAALATALLGGLTSLHGIANRSNLSEQLLADGAISQYKSPGAVTMGLLAMMQNSLVYFNLFGVSALALLPENELPKKLNPAPNPRRRKKRRHSHKR